MRYQTVKMSLYSLDSMKDYRYDLEKEIGELTTSYLSPVDEVSDHRLKAIFCKLAGIEQVTCMC